MTTNITSFSILVVDDDDTLRRSLVLNLERVGYSVVEASNAGDALELLNQRSFVAVLCDLKLPDLDGITFTKRAKESGIEASIILMTGYGSLDLAVEALRAGAYDYISKPFEFDELVLTLKKLEERESLREEVSELRSEISQQYNFNNMISQSESMKQIFDMIKRLSNFSTTVLITGESGTGKELLARAVHYNSPRRAKPFIAINCGAIPAALVESELFGHKKGAFTDAIRDKKGLFEEASGGTVFLDEIGELPLHLQVKLLRVLQEQQIRRVGDEQTINVDVRIVAATLRNLEKDVEEGRFRDDLYYRLNVVSLNLPPLRERTEDIPLLVQHFIEKFSKKLSLEIKGIQPEALKLLLRYGWRGNIRELENCIERSIVLADGLEIDVASLPKNLKTITESTNRTETKVGDPESLSIKTRTRDLEVDLITKALTKTNGNRTHAAKILEISHRALLYKLKEYGLTVLLLLSTIFLSLQPVAAEDKIFLNNRGSSPLYTNKKTSKNDRPVALPTIGTYKPIENPIVKKTCVEHGGVDCSKPADSDGSVVCRSGYKDAEIMHRFACGAVKLEISRVLFDKSGKPTGVEIRNLNNNTAEGVLVKVKISKFVDAVTLDGPEKINGYSVETYLTPPSKLKFTKSNFKSSTISVNCKNCNQP